MNNEQPEVTGITQPAVVGATPAEVNTPTDAPSEGSVDYFASLDDKAKSYLKGIGVEEFTPEAFAKIINSAVSQKASVSRLSREKAEAEAMLASQGELPTQQDPSNPATSEPVTTPEAPTQPVAQPQSNGVSKNDIFDISVMINTNFPELTDEASDGSLFKELTTYGYFTAQGIDKEAIYNHLKVKNEQAKELRELREFKASHAQPEAQEQQYNPGMPITPKVKDVNWAREIITYNITNPGQVDARDLQEAQYLMQSNLF